ncbi:hypothetical protein [Devosia sp. MC1541]|uniref:hypothetical protein n=1 Tax=Devosia sp. MC1541 TaxID=2725264 RepID=UPI00145C8FC3
MSASSTIASISAREYWIEWIGSFGEETPPFLDWVNGPEDELGQLPTPLRPYRLNILAPESSRPMNLP